MSVNIRDFISAVNADKENGLGVTIVTNFLSLLSAPYCAMYYFIQQPNLSEARVPDLLTFKLMFSFQ